MNDLVKCVMEEMIYVGMLNWRHHVEDVFVSGWNLRLDVIYLV